MSLLLAFEPHPQRVGLGQPGPTFHPAARDAVLTTLAVALGQVATFFVLEEESALRLVAVISWGLVVLLGWVARGAAKGLLLRFRHYGCPVVRTLAAALRGTGACWGPE